MKKEGWPDRLLSIKRYKALKKEWRKENKKKRQKRRRNLSRKPRILDRFYDPDRQRKRGSKSDINIKVPPVFSIIDNPEKSLEVVYELANEYISNSVREITIDHSRMQEVDLAAEAVLDRVAKEIKTGSSFKRKKTKFYGHYPDDKNLKRFIKGVGIVKTLDLQHERLPQKEESDLRVFSRTGRKFDNDLNPKDSDYIERVGTEFVDHINDCLKDHGTMLAPGAKQRLSEYTGEIIKNAVEHGGEHDWAIYGYLDKNHPDHICEITIFNLGKTFSRSFLELDEASVSWQEVKPYIEEHEKKGFLGRDWKVSDLLTLVSLQGHVSSKHEDKRSDRGQGTVELIEVFQNLHEECMKEGSSSSSAKMALVSGSTHIYFDGKYRMKEDAHGRSVIAFNERNDLTQEPDKNYISTMKNINFPGSIISIKFPMVYSGSERESI
ncbi:hypothetical protein SAMN05660831_02508 [Thiohalospira halophila DSM 15071]|uniref:Uncharacterized protein n=1 Tax=Thiohalospira halophila DSM 15071 TaxID=1123397 RepID=A0A1I1VY30_9GAMM|nr:hypothetical protein [Thiohalospira halophila]SFD87877.1 hypothetical protein SAMN05660831_02508 [Thiohalospira halophila DSM 15071]